jgi:hypothetical protein
MMQKKIHQTKITDTISFFLKHVKKISFQYSEAMLTAGKCFLVRFSSSFCSELDLVNRKFFPQLLMEKEIKWEVKELRSFLSMITSLISQCQDEYVLREATQILKKCVILGSKLRKVTSNYNLLDAIVHKISEVSTFYSQFKILEILIITGNSCDWGPKFLRQEKFLMTCCEEVFSQAVHNFDCITDDEFLSVSKRITAKSANFT